VLQAMKRANDEQLEAQDAIGGELPPGVVDPNDEALLDAVGSDTSLDMEAVWT
jgi:hypothetical protein